MEDIVEDLRATAGDTDAVENASVARLLENAADEIARLRLTDAEREAIRSACKSVKTVGTEKCFTTLLGLLERLA